MENELEPTANTYSIIGTFTDNSAARADYLDDSSKYTFKLEYRYAKTSLVGYGTTTIQNVFNNFYTEVSPENGNDWQSITNMPMGDGNYYRYFIVIHPNDAGGDTYEEWTLNEQYHRFTAIVGNRGIACTGCQLAFIIYIDGVVIFSSGAMKPDEYQNIDVDISGGTILRIQTLISDSNRHSDWATIANPILKRMCIICKL